MTWKPHATVAAVIHRDDKFLLVEEKIDRQLVLNQPAGHLENGESLIDAVIREVREETAWLFKPEYLLGVYRWRHPQRRHTHIRTTFIGSVSDHHPNQRLDTGIVAAEWWTLEQLQAQPERLRSALVLACIDDYLAGQRFPLQALRDVV